MEQPQAAPGQWFWDVGSAKYGPVSIHELQARAQAGQIGPTTPVWTHGMPAWMPAGQLPVLFLPSGKPVPRSDDGLGLLIPTGPQSGLAIAAGYCAIGGLLCGLGAPVGAVLGFYALRDLNRHPEKRGRGRAYTGIILGGLITLGYLGFFVAISGGSRRPL
jgi:GYF domain 2/Domain of unknown function (DUF4190)